MPVKRPAAPNLVANGPMPANGNAAHAWAPQQTNSTSSTPAVVLESKVMGKVTYDRDAAKMTRFAVDVFIPNELSKMFNNGTKVSLHRVHDAVLEQQGTGDFQFIGQDPHDRGRALVSVEATQGTRCVYEVTFNFKALPLLAQEAHRAPKL